MSEGNRFYIATAIFGLIVTTAGITAWVITPSTQPYPQCQDAKAGNGSATQGHPYKAEDRPRTTGVPSFIQRLTANDDPCHGEDNEKRDLAAQEAAAMWAFWMTIFTGLQFVLSGFGLWALLRTIRQGEHALERAREANDISREGNVAQQRAWLKISPPSCRILWVKPDELSMTRIGVNVSNVGQSVALNANCWAELFLIPMEGEWDVGYFDLAPPDEAKHSKTIWPVDPATFEIDADGLGYDQERFSIDNAFFRVFITIAVEYRTIFDAHNAPPRRTETTYELTKNGGPFTRRDDEGFSVGVNHVAFAPNIVT